MSEPNIQEERESVLGRVEKLEKYVMGYLNKDGIKNDIEKLDEVINVLPSGIVRFKLIEREIIMIEKVAHQQGVLEKDAEIHDGIDASQESHGPQA